MKLTLYTHHAARVLVHLAGAPERLSSISEIARTYGMSQNHLMKVVHDLRKAGFVEAVRGRSGGIRLARSPREITLGDVVRYTETRGGAAVDRPAEDEFLHDIFEAAFGSFFASLDGNSLFGIADAERARSGTEAARPSTEPAAPAKPAS